MIRILGFLVISSLLFTGCKNENDPKSIAINFFDAMAKKDITTAKTYATESSKELLDVIEMAMRMGDSKSKGDMKFDPKNMEFGEAKIEGDKATIPVKDKAKGETIDLALKKENGSWKVAFDKEMMMKEGTKKMGEAKDDMNKEIENANNDSNTEKETAKPDAKINIENFDKIKEGMSYEDVVKIFDGDEGRYVGGNKAPGEETQMYMWQAGEGFDTYIQVTFDKANNKVLGKEQEGL